MENPHFLMDDLGGKTPQFSETSIYILHIYLGVPLSQETLASKIQEFFATHYCPARSEGDSERTGVPNVRFGGRNPLFWKVRTLNLICCLNLTCHFMVRIQIKIWWTTVDIQIFQTSLSNRSFRFFSAFFLRFGECFSWRWRYSMDSNVSASSSR